LLVWQKFAFNWFLVFKRRKAMHTNFSVSEMRVDDGSSRDRDEELRVRAEKDMKAFDALRDKLHALVAQSREKSLATVANFCG
jgi:hypothetical protein